MPDKKLTEKNKQAIEVYLGAGSEEARGNGTKAWQEVYGTKSERTAQANWSRMLSNAIAQEYLEERRKEIEEAVTERVSYSVDEAVADLLTMQKEAWRGGDYGNAIRATVEAGKFLGIYVSKSESTSVQATPEDRQLAGLYGLSISEYLKRKEDGTLGPRPEIPSPTQH